MSYIAEWAVERSRPGLVWRCEFSNGMFDVLLLYGGGYFSNS